MSARIVVFPVKGRNWCFSRIADAVSGAVSSSQPPPTWQDLWKGISSGGRSAQESAEIAVDYVADKMNRAWIGLEKAPAGTVKNRVHSIGLRLLSGVKPSEIFLKSVSNDIRRVEITYPANSGGLEFLFPEVLNIYSYKRTNIDCLNARFVRRRLRHIALRGSALHRKYFYGSVSLLPLSSILSVLPLPNIAFFWILFRAYSHWRALKGSERLLLLVSDDSTSWSSLVDSNSETRPSSSLKISCKEALLPPWVLQPSNDLERLLGVEAIEDGICNGSKGCPDAFLNNETELGFGKLTCKANPRSKQEVGNSFAVCECCQAKILRISTPFYK